LLVEVLLATAGSVIAAGGEDARFIDGDAWGLRS
jgi:hypothetical protein